MSSAGAEADSPLLQFWGGYPTDDLSMYYKIVMSPCAGGDVSLLLDLSTDLSAELIMSLLPASQIVSFYCFMPTEMTNHTQEGFQFAEVPVSDILAGAYSQLDPNCVDLIKNSIDRMPWRLYVHQPYSVSFSLDRCLLLAQLTGLALHQHWTKGNVAVLGDAAHPMMPHQSQGACMAIEDAAALGIIFSKEYGFTTDVQAGLAMYQQIRKPRATRVQNASARATENLNERIGFSSLSAPEAKLAAAENKLTVSLNAPSSDRRTSELTLVLPSLSSGRRDEPVRHEGARRQGSCIKVQREQGGQLPSLGDDGLGFGEGVGAELECRVVSGSSFVFSL